MSLESDDEEGPLGGGAAASAEAARRAAARLGAALALRALAPALGAAEVAASLDFLMGRGLADPDPAVREAMVAAGVAVVDLHGAAYAGTLMPLFEGYLEKRRPAAARGAAGVDEGRYDLVREGVVVLLGTLAAHLDQGDTERAAIVETLLDVLSTPSEAVQRAVSSRLAPLMPAPSAP
ncbi:hypothetical protein MNEG_13985 [Monoraphidium neglectum]|uniref:Uncharacterized protein n=1 Tax=Monoraphidium neglectum TaxID=145388 RepID=A0A0D2KDS0_9CHLO|nr:hypothetical protein MNEG_13985 [Monoraphidium neglectum]KIY93978.1 hypothetical protein MNEG_13985 [Monoraphidium neglectum]|eukprot:XP_013892998.1 hypothetical protein MNEG_13985 [Monoraphidium neglectum]